MTKKKKTKPTSSRTFLNQHIEKENQLATKTLTITQSDQNNRSNTQEELKLFLIPEGFISEK